MADKSIYLAAWNDDRASYNITPIRSGTYSRQISSKALQNISYDALEEVAGWTQKQLITPY